LKSTKSATKSQEKVLLMQLHSQCQLLDKSIGLSPEEFQIFMTMVPEKFKKGAITFDDLDAGSFFFLLFLLTFSFSFSSLFLMSFPSIFFFLCLMCSQISDFNNRQRWLY
jgi:hypothetical protein